MKHFILKKAAALMLAAGCIIFIDGCKKMGQEANQFDEEARIASFREKVRQSGLPTIIPINLKPENIYYEDKNGTLKLLVSNNIQSRGDCGGGLLCSDPTVEDPSEIEDSDITLLYASRVKYCGNAANNSDITVVWHISSVYDIVSVNPSNSSQLTRGRLRFKNSSGSILYTYSSITPVTITNLGADPACSDKTVFELSYTLTGVSNEFFGDGTTMENSFFAYTDCSWVTSLNPQYISTYNIVYNGSAGSPCNRTDKVFISYPAYGSYSQALGVGNVIGCYFPAGWVYPSTQYVEYWNNSAPGTVYSYSLSPFGFQNMTSATYGSGSWTFRYRNTVTSPACVGPWHYEYFTF